MSQSFDPAKRPRQVGDLIRRELALILKRETNDARLNKISITEVDMAPDLKSARVYYTLPKKSDLESVQKALTKGAGFLRQRLADKVALRYVPSLLFLFDDNLESAERISDLLNKIDIDESQEDL